MRRDCPCLSLRALVRSDCARTEGTWRRAGDGQRDGVQVTPESVSKPFPLPGFDQNRVHWRQVHGFPSTKNLGFWPVRESEHEMEKQELPPTPSC